MPTPQRIGKKEYVPARMYEINKYLTEYIYNTGQTLMIEYPYPQEEWEQSTAFPPMFREQVSFTVRKGPGYESNAPKLITRTITYDYKNTEDPEKGDTYITVNDSLEFMSPVLPYDSYSEILQINVYGPKDMKFPLKFYTCGEYGGQLKLDKPDNAELGIFNIIFTPDDGDEQITYYNYHVDAVVNDLTDIKDFNLKDFLDNSPELKSRLCVLQNLPEPENYSSNVTGISIFEYFLRTSILSTPELLRDCQEFIKGYCKDNPGGTASINYDRTCACLPVEKPYTPIFKNDKEKYLYNSLIKTYPNIPLKCVSSFCRNGGYYNNNTEHCPIVCENGDSCEITEPDKKTVVEGKCCDITDSNDTIVKVLSSTDRIMIVPSDAEKEAEAKKQADLIAQEKKKKDAEDEKNQNIVNNFLNLEKNINSKKFNLIMSIIIIFVFFLGSVFLLYKIINKKK